MKNRTILKFASIVILVQAIFTLLAGLVLAAGSSALAGTEYDSMVGTALTLAVYASGEAIFRGVTAVVGLRASKKLSGMKFALILGAILLAVDLIGVARTVMSGSSQGAPAVLLAVAMSGLYVYSVIRIRKEQEKL